MADRLSKLKHIHILVRRMKADLYYHQSIALADAECSKIIKYWVIHGQDQDRFRTFLHKNSLRPGAERMQAFF